MDKQTLGQEVVALWEELTGQAVDSTSYSISVCGNQFGLYEANKRIREALAIGDDGITSLIVRTLAGHYCETEQISLSQAMAGDAKALDRLDILRRMHELFSDHATLELHQNFFQYCAGALAHYRGIQVGDLSEATLHFIRQEGCFVGLDAVTGLNQLTRLMICDGVPGPASDAKLSRLVFGFQSIEELITHARHIPTGFSLGVILAPHISDSYFVMIVRTGQRILALTDKGNYTHPLQEERMRSRNDRYNVFRIDDSHFPYSLLNIQWHDKGRRASEGAGGTKLQPSESPLRVLGNLNELNDVDLLWLQLIIDQCKHRYFDQQLVEPMLATGSMIHIAHKWSGTGTNLPVPADFELPLETRASADLNTAFMHSIEPTWAKRSNPNVWMERRFAAQVPDDCLYIPASALNDETPLLASDSTGRWKLTRDGQKDLRSYQAVQELKRRSIHPLSLRALQQTALSTPERVIADAHFIARFNQAEVIKQLAGADFQGRKEEMQAWFYKAVRKHLPNLINDLICLNHAAVQVNTPAQLSALADQGLGPLRTNFRRHIALSYVPSKDQFVPRKTDPLSLAKVLRLASHSYGQYNCYLAPGEKALLFLELSVATIMDIMVLTGLPLEMIPPELHSRGLDTYSGNSTLDRIDPLSDLRNPWDNLPLSFRLPLSIRAFKVFRKARGLATPPAGELAAWAQRTELEMHPPRPTRIAGLPDLDDTACESRT